MKRAAGIIVVLLVSVVWILPVMAEEEIEPVELIKNGSADQGTDYWGVYVENPAEAALNSENNEILYDIDSVGEDTWHVQGTYAGLRLIEGNNYKLSFDIRASEKREAEVRIQKDSSPYTGYMNENISLGTEMKTFTFEFEMEEPTDPVSKLCFNIGNIDDADDIGSHTVYIDNLSLLDLDGGAGENSEEDKIHVNQVGYLPGESKLLVVAGEADMYEVLDSEGEEVYSGDLSAAREDEASGDIVSYGDFYPVTGEGEYTISVPGLGESYAFKVEDNIYRDVHKSLLKMFYYQRCGTDLTEDYAGTWAHDACHTEPAVKYDSDEEKNVSGGWHDAGDYGRYPVPAAKAVADLLLTYQIYGENVESDNIGIPESGNEIPDILDEVRYEMEWMLKMQDKDSGGVYHKVTTADFQDNEWPDKIDEELILAPVSATATADFAAVAAMTSRVFRDIDPDFAEENLQAAKKAWSWLEENPDVSGFENPPEISTGEYGDSEDGDERYWAVTELYLATGEEQYHEQMIEEYNNNEWEGMGWADVGDYANISYLLAEEDMVEKELYASIEEDFLSRVNGYLDRRREDGYNISLGTEDYIWGSNMVVANRGMQLLIAGELEESNQYRAAAADHLHYLMGRNPLSQSYVTGFGEQSTVNPHHRLSTAAGEVVPGMVAGGPNAELEDPLAQSRLADKAPSKTYIDEEPSYSTNEITIYWNSPAVFLFSAFSEL